MHSYTLYLVDLGCILENDKDSPYCVYDKQYGYYDEDAYFVENKERAISDANDYVADGNDTSYGIVLEIRVTLDEELERYMDDITYELDLDYLIDDSLFNIDDVIYNVVKLNGTIKENFMHL